MSQGELREMGARIEEVTKSLWAYAGDAGIRTAIEQLNKNGDQALIDNAFIEAEQALSKPAQEGQ